MRYYVSLLPDQEQAVDVLVRPDGSVEVQVDGHSVEVDVVDAGGALSVRVGERMFDLWLDESANDGTLRFVSGGVRMQARVESERDRSGARAAKPTGNGGGRVCAPMPGRVVKVLVAEGDVVSAGAPVVVVEAMKMENELCADGAGKVQSILAKAGQTVEGGATLIELAPVPA